MEYFVATKPTQGLTAIEHSSISIEAKGTYLHAEQKMHDLIYLHLYYFFLRNDHQIAVMTCFDDQLELSLIHISEPTRPY